MSKGSRAVGAVVVVAAVGVVDTVVVSAALARIAPALAFVDAGVDDVAKPVVLMVVPVLVVVVPVLVIRVPVIVVVVPVLVVVLVDVAAAAAAVVVVVVVAGILGLLCRLLLCPSDV